MKSILVIFLVLLILGLYFFTEPTKDLMRLTGKAVVDVAKDTFNEVKDSDEFNELKGDFKNKTKEEILKLKGD